MIITHHHDDYDDDGDHHHHHHHEHSPHPSYRIKLGWRLPSQTWTNPVRGARGIDDTWKCEFGLCTNNLSADGRGNFYFKFISKSIFNFWATLPRCARFQHFVFHSWPPKWLSELASARLSRFYNFDKILSCFVMVMGLWIGGTNFVPKTHLKFRNETIKFYQFGKSLPPIHKHFHLKNCIKTYKKADRRRAMFRCARDPMF